MLNRYDAKKVFIAAGVLDTLRSKYDIILFSLLLLISETIILSIFEKKIHPMAKQSQLLSPENYIRQKSRNLPIYECRINSDWEEGKLASVIIARSHVNGNITFCIYLVDLGCLGVKDSMYYFNMPIDEFRDYIDKFEEKLPSETTSYELAHNIIYAGIEFAEEYGFKPCKEYLSTTKYMLEEDSDEIELIEIEVGDKDGDPLYVNNGYESPTRVNQILNQLDKTAGENNYTYTDNLHDLNDLGPNNDLSESDFEELKDQFILLYTKGIDKLSKAETLKFVDITDEIYIHLCSDVEIGNYLDSWQNELNYDLDPNYNCEILGVDKDFVITDKLLRIIDDTIIQIDKKPEKANKKLDELEKLIGSTHFIAFLRLEILKVLSPSEVSPKLKEYIKEFPDCSMLKLLVEFVRNFSPDKPEKSVPSVETIFQGRETVTLYEMYRYWNDKLLIIANQEDLNMLEAFYLFVEEIDLKEELMEMLKSSTALVRIFVLDKYLKNL